MWQIWLIAAGVFLIIEIFTIGFFVFWLSIGSLLAMLVSLVTSNLAIQCTVFIISSTILIFATKPLVNRFQKKDTTPTNVYSLVGKRGVVIEDINWTTGQGQIKASGEIWSAKTNDHVNIPKGSEVEIVSIDGVKAFVKPIKIVSTNTN